MVSFSKVSSSSSEFPITKIDHAIEANHVMEDDIVHLAQNKAQLAPDQGRNVSGRSWKVRTQKRASSLIKTKLNNQTLAWDRKQAAKQASREAKQLQSELVEEKRQAAILKKERRLENEKRRQENELKSIQKSVQTLNTNKIGVTLKAMSKKQLRQVKKTRVNTKTGVVEYVPAYSK
jgi:hypothetical protein